MGLKNSATTRAASAGVEKASWLALARNAA